MKKLLAVVAFLLASLSLAQSPNSWTQWPNTWIAWNGGQVASFYSQVQNNGVNVAQEQILNFVPGTNITYSFADTPGNPGVTSITINASAGGSPAFSSITSGTNTTAAMNCTSPCSFINEVDAIGTTPTVGHLLQNVTAATAGTTLQYSPSQIQCGTGWNTTGLASETDCLRFQVQPATGNPTSLNWFIDASIAGGAYSNIFRLASNGTVTTTAGIIVSAGNVGLSSVTGQFNAAGPIAGAGGLNIAYANGGSSLVTGNRLVTASCSGASTCATTTNIPANAVVLSVATRITGAAITGSTTYELGTTLNPGAFCTGLTIFALNSTYACGGGSTNVTGLQNTAAATLLVTSTVGGNFTSATIFEFEITYILVTPPTS